MNDTKKSKFTSLKFGPFYIDYWASGSGNTFVGISRIPFKDSKSDWFEYFETVKIYTTAEEAKKVILEDTKRRLRDFAEANSIKIEE